MALVDNADFAVLQRLLEQGDDAVVHEPRGGRPAAHAGEFLVDVAPAAGTTAACDAGLTTTPAVAPAHPKTATPEPDTHNCAADGAAPTGVRCVRRNDVSINWSRQLHTNAQFGLGNLEITLLAITAISATRPDLDHATHFI